MSAKPRAFHPILSALARGRHSVRDLRLNESHPRHVTALSNRLPFPSLKLLDREFCPCHPTTLLTTNKSVSKLELSFYTALDFSLDQENFLAYLHLPLKELDHL